MLWGFYPAMGWLMGVMRNSTNALSCSWRLWELHPAMVLLYMTYRDFIETWVGLWGLWEILLSRFQVHGGYRNFIKRWLRSMDVMENSLNVVSGSSVFLEFYPAMGSFSRLMRNSPNMGFDAWGFQVFLLKCRNIIGLV